MSGIELYQRAMQDEKKNAVMLASIKNIEDQALKTWTCRGKPTKRRKTCSVENQDALDITPRSTAFSNFAFVIVLSSVIVQTR